VVRRRVGNRPTSARSARPLAILLGVRSPGICFGFVFLCAATIAPLGDHFHVACGVTEYLTDFGPIWIGNSPLWFILLVAGFLASLSVVHGHLRLGGTRPISDRRIFLSPLFVLALYLTTSFYPLRDGGSLEAIITAGAGALWLALDRSRLGLFVGLGVAGVATATEWGLVQLQVFRYLPGSDELLGVAPWLLPLYFAAAVAVGTVGRRMIGGRVVA
jgi:hypothetical protein